MKRSVAVPLAVCAGAFLAAPHAPAQLSIKLDYAGDFTGETDDAKLRRKVAAAAASLWETTLADARVKYTVDITVGMADLTNEGLPTARTYSNEQTAEANATTGTCLPTKATVELHSNLDWLWFDPTPLDNSEFNKVTNTRWKHKDFDTYKFKYDALTVLLHEMGHALGFLGATGKYNDDKPYTVYSDFSNNYAEANKFTFDYLKTGKGGSMNGPLKTVAMDNFHITQNVEAIMRPGDFDDRGFRQLITPLDRDIIADAFRLTEVPAPGSLTLLAGASLLVFHRRRA